MGKYKVILLLINVISIAGCIETSSSDTYKQPQGEVILSDKDYTMMISDFDWKEDDFEIEKVSPTDINDFAENFKKLAVEKGEKLKIGIEQNPSSIIVDQWNEDGTRDEVELKNNEITVPLEKGYYIFEVITEWDEGTVSYIYDINIK